ncbi:PREDICTED: uncharacterized protein LOC109216871 [Nicotiana attenuata]|uniref:uncharacterized protein LOC109216871 n=1 Tax=Nicotiana attenuata TaxID=49451 RepID=UPI000904D06F|nr:PREDICTED: uncharacterized protein LOC109216871 [Nicotiana attenuata]
MAVTTRSEKGGDATTSSQKNIVDDEQLVQGDEMPSNEVQANDEVRIDIEDHVEENQEEVKPSREHIVDISELVVPKAKAPMPRLPPPYPQRLAKQNGENQFKKIIDMMKSFSINVSLVEALEQMPGYANATMNSEDNLEAVMLNLDNDEEKEGYVECVNALQGMGL